jgi:hypothetical protein
MSKLTLKANFNEGSGSIGNKDQWKKIDPLLRLDILKDWIAELEEEYKVAFHDNRKLMGVKDELQNN